MDWGSPGLVVVLVVISTMGWLINNWIRAKHGYSLEDEFFGKTDKPETRGDNEVREQNRKLIETMERMQDRMVVLERIVTDKGYTVAEEIEALRDTPVRNTHDSGTPLNTDRKERA